jgi:hypothetical protein
VSVSDVNRFTSASLPQEAGRKEGCCRLLALLPAALASPSTSCAGCPWAGLLTCCNSHGPQTHSALCPKGSMSPQAACLCHVPSQPSASLLHLPGTIVWCWAQLKTLQFIASARSLCQVRSHIQFQGVRKGMTLGGHYSANHRTHEVTGERGQSEKREADDGPGELRQETTQGSLKCPQSVYFLVPWCLARPSFSQRLLSLGLAGITGGMTASSSEKALSASSLKFHSETCHR